MWVFTSFYYNYFSYYRNFACHDNIYICLSIFSRIWYFIKKRNKNDKNTNFIMKNNIKMRISNKISISKHKASFFYELDPLSRDLIWKYIKCIRKIYWYHLVRWTHCHSTEMNKISKFHFQCISSIASFPKKGNTYSRIIL